MNPYDPLETELALFQPIPPSPHLRERIARELNTSDSDQLSQAPMRQAEPAWAFVSGMLAASILALLCWFAIGRGPKDAAGPLAEPRYGHKPSRNEIATAIDPALPSLWTYHRALAAGPYELDALLVEHAQTGPSVNKPAHDLQIGPMRGFVSSEAELHSLIQGDL